MHTRATGTESVEAPRILVVDDKANIRELLFDALSQHGYVVEVAPNGDAAVALLEQAPFDVVITDLNMPGKNGLEVLRAAKALNSDTEVIIITAYGTMETAVEALRLGARDFIGEPFKVSELENKVQRLLQGRGNAQRPVPHTSWHPSVQHIVGSSAATRNLLKMIAKIAPSNSSVLITGPSGVGKELVARALHEASPRRDKPFVALNCAALAPGVLDMRRVRLPGLRSDGSADLSAHTRERFFWTRSGK